ncbi:unnamed protein product [Musa textilis]
MAKLMQRSLLLAALLLLVAAAGLTPAAAAGGGAGGDLPLGWIPSLSGCRGSIAECLAGEEFDLGSEVSRRFLATSSYISYGALKRDTVPCSRPAPLTTTAAPAPRPTPTLAAAPPSPSAGVKEGDLADLGSNPRKYPFLGRKSDEFGMLFWWFCSES